jgi:hydrogenase maturation protein HypF
VVEGQALVSQHVGDLKHLAAQKAFRETIDDLLRMYAMDREDLLVVHDRHPQYASTRHAREELPGEKRAVQHHRAHIASVLAEREAWDKRVVGVAFDGTGYGPDANGGASIWGGEVFVGSLVEGFDRAAHLRPAVLPGGDAAAKAPVQAAAGFLAELERLPDLTAPPFAFPSRYRHARTLVQKGIRTFPTTSVGRLFDTVAALLGFTRKMTFEGQAAIWLEHQGRAAPCVEAYPFPKLDFRPLLHAVIADRQRERPVAEIARAFHRGLAQGVMQTSRRLCDAHGLDTLVLSGGVFQNQLLLHEIKALRDETPGLSVWTNRAVPANDGGISLGQAALAALRGV